jgi:hypothetical protein
MRIRHRLHRAAGVEPADGGLGRRPLMRRSASPTEGETHLACLFERFVVEFKEREELTAQALFGFRRSGAASRRGSWNSMRRETRSLTGTIRVLGKIPSNPRRAQRAAVGSFNSLVDVIRVTHRAIGDISPPISSPSRARSYYKALKVRAQ